MGQPAIFLDRDGVIIENRDRYVRSWADVAILPGALQALAAVRDSAYQLIMVTNQSAVGRGIISLATAEATNRRLLDESGPATLTASMPSIYALMRRMMIALVASRSRVCW